MQKVIHVLLIAFVLFLMFSCDLSQDAELAENKIDELAIEETRAPKPVKLWAKVNYKGKKVALEVGQYNQAALQKAGMKDNDVESVKVKKGFQATLFDGGNFNGTKVVIKKNTKKLGSNIINKVSSVIVAKVGSGDDDDDDDDDDDNDDNDDNGGKKRVGVSSDGNVHDKDDIGASAFSVAYIAAFGDKYVHHDYSNHLGKAGSNNGAMQTSVTGAAQKFFGSTSMTFNCQSNLQGAIKNGSNQINRSSAKDRFYYACGGPMEVPWRVINAAQPAKRQYCTAISHSSWNDKHQDKGCDSGGKGMSHTWSSIQKSGAVAVHISNQNNNFKTSASAWNGLANINHAGVNWLKSRMKKGGDVSDSGMVWYICTGGNGPDPKGDNKGTPAKALNKFAQKWGKK